MDQKKALGKAVVTGSSSGIGAVYADRLARRGFDLVLVARDVSRLNKLAERLTKETGRKIEVLGADLTQKSDMLKIEILLKTDAAISLLVNNAGSATVTPFLETSADALEAMINLNVTALTRLSAAAAPGFVKRSGGTIINISSVAALGPGLVSGTYSATKAFVLNLSQALHDELSSQGVQIQAVLPGLTRTEIWQRGGMDIETFPKELVMSAEDMVDAALVALDRKELITLPALPNASDWNNFEAARKALAPNFSHAKPAARYLN